jgi:XTP/dITP diphosphohydrolase/tetrapyrrole methylase family protein/MazG family protein
MAPPDSDKIYDRSFDPSEEELSACGDFVAIVRQLRRDCPWDREQTHESVRHLLIEEAYETVEAIERQDWDELKRELGDLLLHVVFHSAIAEQSAAFTFREVVEHEIEKLVRRHPHVFGDVETDSVETVLSNWEKIKSDENPDRSALSGVPRTLPGLLRAYRIQEKAAGVGFDFPGPEEAWMKVEEEISEYRSGVAEGKRMLELEHELGDVLFALVNHARLEGVDPENALRRTNDRFLRRFAHIESRLEERGLAFDDVTLDQMDVWWEEAKQQEDSL